MNKKEEKISIEKTKPETEEKVIETEDKIEEITKEEKKPEKKEEKKLNMTGIAYIYTTPNNTVIHITDLAGNTISRVSGGMVTKHSRLKANPTVAMFAAKKAAEIAKDAGISGIYVRVRAKTRSTSPGPGGHAAVKNLAREGLKIINIVDVTRVPRGGPKIKGGKRGRRV
jgi:small subunit ribosomal protein S11